MGSEKLLCLQWDFEINFLQLEPPGAPSTTEETCEIER